MSTIAAQSNPENKSQQQNDSLLAIIAFMGNSFSKYDTFIAISNSIHLLFYSFFIYSDWTMEFTEVWNPEIYDYDMKSWTTNWKFLIRFSLLILLVYQFNLKITLTCHYYQPFLLGFLRESLKTRAHRNDEKYCKIM